MCGDSVKRHFNDSKKPISVIFLFCLSLLLSKNLSHQSSLPEVKLVVCTQYGARLRSQCDPQVRSLPLQCDRAPGPGSQTKTARVFKWL